MRIIAFASLALPACAAAQPVSPVGTAILEVCPSLQSGRLDSGDENALSRLGFRRDQRMEASIARADPRHSTRALVSVSGDLFVLIAYSANERFCNVTFTGSTASRVLDETIARMTAEPGRFRRLSNVGDPREGFPNATRFQSSYSGEEWLFSIYRAAADDASGSFVASVQPAAR